MEVIGFDSYNFGHPVWTALPDSEKRVFGAARWLILRDGEAEGGSKANIPVDSSGAVTNPQAPRRFRVNSTQVRTLGPNFLMFCRKRSTSRPV
jgi:hypothetical protein